MANKKISNKDQDEIDRRFKILIKYSAHKSLSPSVKEKIAEELGVSIQHARKIIHRYQDMRCRSALKPRKTGVRNGTKKLNRKVEKIIEQNIQRYFASSLNPSKKSLYRLISKACTCIGLKPPSITTIRNRIDNFDAEYIAKKQLGNSKGHSKRGRALKTFSASYPLELTQADHTEADIHAVCAESGSVLGRPWITFLLDIFTRCILGFHITFHPPSSLTVALLLTHAIWSKQKDVDGLDHKLNWNVYGVPTTIHLDGAKEFRSHALLAGCKEYGIQIQDRPKNATWYGGHVERIMRTFNTLLHDCPGTSKSNPIARAEYDSQGRACLTLNDIEKFLILAINIYHNEEHKDLPMEPIAMWKDAIDKGFVPREAADKQKLFWAFLPLLNRTLQREGVRIHNLHYVNFDLPHYSNFIGQRVRP